MKTKETYLIVTADDFGYSEAVNRAVQKAAMDGILTRASLMVTGKAADQAIDIAKNLPFLEVGLHVNLSEGFPLLPQKSLYKLLDNQGKFKSSLATVGTALQLSKLIQQQVKAEIEAHPIATYIGEFDHYSHTTHLEAGKVSEDIKDAKNLICCFGKELPRPEILAVRPRSIGVAEMHESFVISFMEAPNPDANAAMESWAKAIANR